MCINMLHLLQSFWISVFHIPGRVAVSGEGGKCSRKSTIQMTDQ